MADTTNKYNFLDYEGLSLFWNNVKKVIGDNELVTATALTNLNTRVDTVEDALANQIISITYTDLKTRRDNAQLVPGQQYRITDYTCTTTSTGTTSAGHQFDIIVRADSENKLNEEASAIKHEGDEYFANNNLSAWKIWYCIDNDTTRFAWADSTNGKGVIYRMIDEFNNDIPYDFKNIQFKYPKDTTTYPYYYYTFASSNIERNTDYSLSIANECYSNVIKEYITSGKRTLNQIIFIGINCYFNSFSSNCYNNTLGTNCYYNSFGNDCKFNSFGNFCSANSFGDYCTSNTFGYSCSSNTVGDSCTGNAFGSYCSYNSVGKGCAANSFGSFCRYNSFGNYCYYNSFRVSPSTTSSLKNYVYYNHFDDGCSFNVIWNSKTTSSTILLKNINVNRGVAGTSSSYNMINIDVLNSEQEINVNQIDGIVSIINISDIPNKLNKIIELNYSELVTLRDNAQLIPGQQYRIIDYITTTAQENTKSAWHQFDIIVTALDESTLSEEAQAIQNSNDAYFDGSNLSAWKIWYCLDNDTNRFAWAGDNVKVDEIERKSYDSSKCTIKPELINGNEFITPFNFESCVWVDGNNDGFAYSDNHIHHDISELIYEWGYFTDDNGDTQLCIYKSDADLYAEDGHPDYGDKYLYRGVVNVDGAEYDYWQKWDEWNSNGNGGLNIHGGDDYVYATTQRIVSNPEAYSATIETEDVYGPGKGVIYRMIDEWNNDCPYDFKNIMFARDWSTIAPDSGLSGTIYCYTFSVFLDGFSEGATASDESVKAKECIESDGEGNFGNNVIKPYQNSGICSLNDIVFYTDWSNGCVYQYDNTFGNDCYNNSFGTNCYNNTAGNHFQHNTFGDNYLGNTFGNECQFNTFGNDCIGNTFGNECSSNTFGNDCYNNSFDTNCYNNTVGNSCSYNSFGNKCRDNTVGDNCQSNTLGNNCAENTFGNDCSYNTFGNYCYQIKFASDSSTSATKYNYYQYNHFGDGCQYILFRGTETASSKTQVQNYNFSQGLQGTSSAYLTIDGVRNLSYEAKVAKNSKGEIKIYCEADLIA